MKRFAAHTTRGKVATFKNAFPKKAKAAAPNVTDGTVAAGADPDSYVKCDRCGRAFLARYGMCVCRG